MYLSIGKSQDNVQENCRYIELKSTRNAMGSKHDYKSNVFIPFLAR